MVVGHWQGNLAFMRLTPDIATCMYYTGLDPFTKEEVYIARNLLDRKPQRALLQFFKEAVGLFTTDLPGGFGLRPMKKGDQGVWELALGAVEPGASRRAAPRLRLISQAANPQIVRPQPEPM